jgi:polysaccharide biosynthesis/export protein
MRRRINLLAYAGLVWITIPSVCRAQALSNVDTVTNASSVTNGGAGSTIGKPQFQNRDQRYEIQPGDSFDVTFDLSPEFNQTGVAVQPDGFVTLRGIGDVKVQGQTVPQLIQTLHQAYGKILNDPLISVVLKDFQKPYFIADGQVARPGKYELRADTTLTEAIAIAGGFTESSKHSQVLLFRRINDQWTTAKLFNLKQMEKIGDLHEDPFLHPGDMLFVPKNRLSKVRAFLPTSGVNAMTKTF